VRSDVCLVTVRQRDGTAIMHLKRWITGLAAIPLLVFLILRGGLPFTFLVGLASMAAQWEYMAIVRPNRTRRRPGIIPLIGLAAVPLVTAAAHGGHWSSLALVLAIDLLAAGTLSLTAFRRDPRVVDEVPLQLQGVIYTGLLLALLIPIRQAPHGMEWIFTILVVVFAGDTGALYAGTFWGRHKLAPAISPGKTIEGSCGGLICNLLAGSLLNALLLPEALPWATALAFFLCLGVAGQIGDLFESQLKRVAGVKDSGRLLPGHGGILDRIDALLFAAPVAFAFRFGVF
jgi:phosphatidate cytidylyltransferase